MNVFFPFAIPLFSIHIKKVDFKEPTAQTFVVIHDLINIH